MVKLTCDLEKLDFKTGIYFIRDYVIFQYALSMKKCTRKLSSSKKSLSKILTQKNL